MIENIHDLIRASKLSEVSDLLDLNNSYLNQADTIKGNLPLHTAVICKNLAATSLLIKYGSDINCLNKKDEAPLHISCQNNDIEISKCLLENGADLNLNDKQYNPPFYYACQNKNTELMSLLLEYGFNLRFESFRWDIYLNFAFESNNLELFKLLIGNGVNINRSYYIRRKHGSPLYYACQSGNLELINFLIKKGADINTVLTELQKSPEFFTKNHQNIKILELLREKGADLEYRNWSNYGLIHAACENSNFQMIQYLSDLGVELNTQTGAGDTPLHFACRNGDKEIIDFLLEKGLETNSINESGFTPFDILAENGNIDIIRNLYERGINLNNNINYSTLLHFASSGKNLELVKFLVEIGENINKVNKEGYSPLHFACKAENLAIVNYLISRGANINISGVNPISLCNNNYEMVKLLVDKGLKISDNSVLKGCNEINTVKLLAEKGIAPDKELLYESLKKDNAEIFSFCLSQLNVNDNEFTELMNEALIRWRNNIVNKFLTEDILFKIKYNYGLKMTFEQAINLGFRVLSIFIRNNFIIPKPEHLYYAVRNKNEQLFDLLLNYFSPLEVSVNNFRDTPLIIFAFNLGYYDWVKKLLDLGFDINRKLSQGDTLLIKAVSKMPNLSFIEFLLKNGAEVNAVNEKGESALHLACMNLSKVRSREYVTLLELLLKYGADLTLKTTRERKTRRYVFPAGSAPIDIVKIKGAREIETFLLKHFEKNTGA